MKELNVIASTLTHPCYSSGWGSSGWYVTDLVGLCASPLLQWAATVETAVESLSEGLLTPGSRGICPALARVGEFHEDLIEVMNDADL